MTARLDWVLLAYRMPREPSTRRIAVWRKLRRLGVAQVVDGLVALPADARTREQLDWLADEILEAGGEATIWLGRLTSAAQERAIAERMSAAVTVEYRRLIDDARAAQTAPEGIRRRTLARLRREHRRIAQRDYFPPVEAEQARQALTALAELIEVPA
jgi:hypothetical protein